MKLTDLIDFLERELNEAKEFMDQEVGPETQGYMQELSRIETLERVIDFISEEDV